MQCPCSVARDARLSSFLSFVILFIVPVVTQSNYTLEVCPKDFVYIAKKCYFFSQDKTVFEQAHFNCRARNSVLAVLSRPNQERQLRNYMNKHKHIVGSYDRWIGASYNWAQTQWVWSASGEPVIFNAFFKMNQCKDWSWNCAIIDPSRSNLWYAKKCFEETQYICQTKANSAARPSRWKKDFNVSKCNQASLSPEERRRCARMLNPHKREKKPPGMMRVKPTPPRRPRKIYICPSHMILLGNNCYYFSTTAEAFQEAHYFCLENNTKLAVVRSKGQDKLLREFLSANYVDHRERWIGGTYDWKNNKWKWSATGKELKYKGFAPGVVQGNLYWVGIVVDPRYNYQWNIRNVSHNNYFICQRRAKRVPYKGVVGSNEPLPDTSRKTADLQKYKHNYV